MGPTCRRARLQPLAGQFARGPDLPGVAGAGAWGQASVGRTADCAQATVQDVGVDHGRAEVLVAQKLLDGPDACQPASRS